MRLSCLLGTYGLCASTSLLAGSGPLDTLSFFSLQEAFVKEQELPLSPGSEGEKQMSTESSHGEAGAWWCAGCISPGLPQIPFLVVSSWELWQALPSAVRKAALSSTSPGKDPSSRLGTAHAECWLVCTANGADVTMRDSCRPV